MIQLTTITDQTAYEALRRSLFALLFKAPLAGLTILGESIDVIEDKKIATMCTDGRKIWYSPAWVLKKGFKSTTFDLLHEWLHVFGNHPARRGNRDEERWNYAADVRVAHDALAILNQNGKLSEWTLEEDHVPALPWAKDLSVEEIYAKLTQQEEADKKEAEDKGEAPPEPLTVKPDRQDLRAGSGGPAPTPAQESKFLETFASELAQAQVSIETAKGSIKDLYGDAIFTRLQQVRRGGIPWELMHLGRIADQLGHQSPTWSRPNRRYFPQIILPGYRSLKEKELLVGVDISGSIDDALIQRYTSNIITAARGAMKTTIVTFDQVVRECVTTTRPEELLRKLKFKSGSHSRTSVVDLFKIVDERKPTAVSIMTDGYIDLPDKPYHETNWVVIPDGKKQPWGRHFVMQQSW